MSTHDLTDLLPRIDVPVLIFAAEKDVFTPAHRAETTTISPTRSYWYCGGVMPLLLTSKNTQSSHTAYFYERVYT